MQVFKNASRIYDVLAAEEGAFVTTLEKGQKILEELLVKAGASKDKVWTGDGSKSGMCVMLLPQ